MTLSPSELKANQIVVTLPIPPKELSPNARSHWAKKAKAVANYRKAAHMEGVAAVFPRPRLTAATIHAQWFTRTVTRPDADNALASLKAAFDGLTDAGIFSDDKGLTHLPIKFAKDAKNPRVVLTITPTLQPSDESSK